MSTSLQRHIGTAKRVAYVFIAWNVIFFMASLVLKNSVADDAVGSVLLRGGFYAVGGWILVFLLRQMTQGKRSGWFRLMIISLLAPIGVVAFIALTPHLPIWFDAGQIGSALLLLGIATIILRKNVRDRFPKSSQAA